jgi:hypothetical protein
MKKLSSTKTLKIKIHQKEIDNHYKLAKEILTDEPFEKIIENYIHQKLHPKTQKYEYIIDFIKSEVFGKYEKYNAIVKRYKLRPPPKTEVTFTVKANQILQGNGLVIGNQPITIAPGSLTSSGQVLSYDRTYSWVTSDHSIKRSEDEISLFEYTFLVEKIDE